MAVSLVFQGEDIDEVKEAILKYMHSEMSLPQEPEKKVAPAKKKTAARKKAAAKPAEVPEDPMDLFGDDDDANAEEPSEPEGDDPFGATDPTIEDVKNALGEVVSVWDEKNNTGADKAKKILAVYGDADDLGSLIESLYRKVIANSNLVVEKANG